MAVMPEAAPLLPHPNHRAWRPGFGEARTRGIEYGLLWHRYPTCLSVTSPSKRHAIPLENTLRKATATVKPNIAGAACTNGSSGSCRDSDPLLPEDGEAGGGFDSLACIHGSLIAGVGGRMGAWQAGFFRFRTWRGRRFFLPKANVGECLSEAMPRRTRGLAPGRAGRRRVWRVAQGLGFLAVARRLAVLRGCIYNRVSGGGVPVGLSRRPWHPYALGFEDGMAWSACADHAKFGFIVVPPRGGGRLCPNRMWWFLHSLTRPVKLLSVLS